MSALIAMAIEAIAKITSAVIDAQAGKVTPEQAIERIRGAVKDQHDVDARIDVALEDKFRDEGGGGG